MWTDLVLRLAGIVLLVLLVGDVLVTVFHPRGHGGPVNRRQNQRVWRLFRRLGVGRRGVPNRALLAYCGPVLAVLTIVTWSALLVVGFALLYYPDIASFPVSPGAAPVEWVNALYYSGYIASTVGLGDIAPATPEMRLLTVIEGLAGFGLFTMSVSYVLAVYRELAASYAFAMHLHGYFRHGIARVLERIEAGEVDSFDAWADAATMNLLRAAQSNAQYPILQYFYAADFSQALVAQIAPLVNLIRVVQRGDAPEAHRRFRERPEVDALRWAVARYLTEVERNLVPAGFEASRAGDEADTLVHKHDRIREWMLYTARTEAA